MKNCHPKIEDGIDLRILPHITLMLNSTTMLSQHWSLKMDFVSYAAVGSAINLMSPFLWYFIVYASKDLILLFLLITSTVDMTGMMNLGMFVEELFV